MVVCLKVVVPAEGLSAFAVGQPFKLLNHCGVVAIDFFFSFFSILDLYDLQVPNGLTYGHKDTLPHNSLKFDSIPKPGFRALDRYLLAASEFDRHLEMAIRLSASLPCNIVALLSKLWLWLLLTH